VTPPDRVRCEWAGADPLMVAYHDDEWGTPTHDDHELFELLTLEGAQAGLSWTTILRKREGYRAAFARFDAEKVARFTDRDVERLLGDASIVRHRGKIESTISNARALLDLRGDAGTFDDYVWSFVDGTPIVSHHTTLGGLPTSTDEAKALAKDLKRRGFRFVGPTTVYAFMQAAGLADDHVVTCFRRTG
jgi:DNA-3-methyladenine glycosylase I